MSTLKAKNFHLIEDMDIAAGVFAAVERVEAFAAKVSTMIGTWARRSGERRLLRHMSDHMLNDIGLSRHDVERESSKFFWQS